MATFNIQKGRWVFNPDTICADGYKVSIQAGHGSPNGVSPAYCRPRLAGDGPFTHVELGFPSQHDDLIEEYREGAEWDDDPQTDSVFPWVPVEVVAELIAKHGGVVDGFTPHYLEGFTVHELERNAECVDGFVVPTHEYAEPETDCRVHGHDPYVPPESR